jgi:hypothetical protein
MNYIIEKDNIKLAYYGILHKISDITEIIIKHFNENDILILSELFSNNVNNHYYNKMSVLTLYLKTGKIIKALHGSTIKLKTYVEVINNNININNNYINNNYINKNININNNYIVSTNARDESNIIEWIIYHLLIGFDKVVIIDHKSIIPIFQLIQPYDWKHRVHVIRREDDGAIKMKFLNEVIIPYMMINCKKYFIHLDADEYIYLNKDLGFTKIDSFLSKYNADILVMHWLMFGTNNIQTNNHPYKCLIPTFTKSDTKLVSHFKCFIKIKKNIPFIFTSPHTIKYIKTKSIIDIIFTNVMNKKYTRKLLDNINIEELFNNMSINDKLENIPAYINHYYLQSIDDYMHRKINRVRDDINESRSFDSNLLTMYNDVDNYNIQPFSKNIINMIENIKTFGFIMIRYVNSVETNNSWIRCYNSIRQFYNNMIIIIDDNSDINFLTNHPTINTRIINSEFHKRGEFLPYYYYIKNKFFYRAVVLHDSMTIKKYYDFMNINIRNGNKIIKYSNYTRLFSFPNNAYRTDIEHFKEMCNYIKNGDLVYKYHNMNINNLNGCFGVCYVIDYEFLNNVQKKYNIINLINFIDTRRKRMSLERFLSCLFEYIRGKSFITPIDLFGSIFNRNHEYIDKQFFGR